MFGAKDVGPMWNDKEEKKTIRSQGMIKKKPCFHTTPNGLVTSSYKQCQCCMWLDWWPLPIILATRQSKYATYASMLQTEDRYFSNVYMYIYIHTYIYIHLNTYLNRYIIRIYIYIYINVYLHIKMYSKFIYACVSLCVPLFWRQKAPWYLRVSGFSGWMWNGWKGASTNRSTDHGWSTNGS